MTLASVGRLPLIACSYSPAPYTILVAASFFPSPSHPRTHRTVEIEFLEQFRDRDDLIRRLTDRLASHNDAVSTNPSADALQHLQQLLEGHLVMELPQGPAVDSDDMKSFAT